MSTQTMKRYAIRTLLAVAAVVGLSAGAGGLYAYGQSVGRDQVALDAGPAVADRSVAAADAIDAGQDLAAAAPKTKVPAPSSSPSGVLEVAKDARQVGGLWLVIVVLLFAAAAEVRQRTAPKPGDDEPDPRSWRARSYALACGVAALTATLIDIGFGGVGWSALAVPGAFAVGRIWDAFNPPKGSKAKAGGVS